MNQYPMRTLSELTGIPATTLRAWERRYGLLEPVRTPAGHRSEAFTARLERLGGHCLGSNHGRALDRMEHIVPAFSVP